jgi:predicted nucleotidyltransferase
MLKPETLDYLKKEAKTFGVKKMILFGSCLHKSDDEAGDIDLAIEGLDGITLCYFVGELLLSKDLKKQVDVVDLSGDIPIIPIALDEGIVIYEEKR